MAQTKFDKQVEETAESLAFGIGRLLAGRPMDGGEADRRDVLARFLILPGPRALLGIALCRGLGARRPSSGCGVPR